MSTRRRWPGLAAARMAMSIMAFRRRPAPGVPVAAEPLPADRTRVGEQSSASGHGARRNLPSIGPLTR